LRRVGVDQGTTGPAGLVAGHEPDEDRRRFHVTAKGVTLITAEMLGQYKTHLH
jgi:glucose-1-phosphate adenylyltransferase